ALLGKVQQLSSFGRLFAGTWKSFLSAVFVFEQLNFRAQKSPCPRFFRRFHFATECGGMMKYVTTESC
ncbi:hypothetical protein ABTA78_19740, partial [Acinetobacter baumannii]